MMLASDLLSGRLESLSQYSGEMLRCVARSNLLLFNTILMLTGASPFLFNLFFLRTNDVCSEFFMASHFVVVLGHQLTLKIQKNEDLSKP